MCIQSHGLWTVSDWRQTWMRANRTSSFTPISRNSVVIRDRFGVRYGSPLMTATSIQVSSFARSPRRPLCDQCVWRSAGRSAARVGRSGWRSRPPVAGSSRRSAESGLGDVTDPLLSSRGIDSRIESRVAADRLGVGEPLKVADLGDHRGGRDERHAWEAGQNSIDLTERIPLHHLTDRSFHLGDLPLGERERIDALPEHLHVPARQLLSLGLEVTNQSVALHAAQGQAGCWRS